MNFNKQYTIPLSLYFILCVFLSSCSIDGSQKMYTIGQEWKTEQCTFTVLSATLCSSYQIPAQNTVMPDQNCEFLAVECNIEYFHEFELTKCNIQKNDIYSGKHQLHTSPILLSDKPSDSGENYILLFSVPLTELNDGTAAAYTMAVTIKVSDKSYSENFSLGIIS